MPVALPPQLARLPAALREASQDAFSASAGVYALLWSETKERIGL